MKRLLAVLALTLALSAAAAEVEADGRFVCGLNPAGRPYSNWASGISSTSTWTVGNASDFEALSLMQRLTHTDFMPDEHRELGLPAAVWLIAGADNAFAGRVAEGSEERSVQILLDDSWVRGLESASENPWIRETVLAHELGHLIHGDVWGLGAQTTWRQEYDADVFAGYAMCKLGAPENAVCDFFRLIARDCDREDVNNHPSLRYRLAAVREGYTQARRE